MAQWPRTARPARGHGARGDVEAAVAGSCGLSRVLASTMAMAASLGRRYSPGKRRSPVSQSNTLETATCAPRRGHAPCRCRQRCGYGRRAHRIVENVDLGRTAGLVGLDGDEVVGAGVHYGCGDLGIAGDGVDGDQRAGESSCGGQPLQKQRECLLLSVRFRSTASWPNQPLTRGEGGDQMQRTPLAAIVAAARGLAVNGDQVRRIRPHRRRPDEKQSANSAGSMRFIRMRSQRTPGTP